MVVWKPLLPDLLLLHVIRYAIYELTNLVVSAEVILEMNLVLCFDLIDVIGVIRNIQTYSILFCSALLFSSPSRNLLSGWVNGALGTSLWDRLCFLM